MTPQDMLRLLEELKRPPLGVPIGMAWTRKRIRHTRNIFGRPEDLVGAALKVIERNERGDCLCLFERGGTVVGLVDVDFRDVQFYLSRDFKTASWNPPRYRRFVVDVAGVCQVERVPQGL